MIKVDIGSHSNRLLLALHFMYIIIVFYLTNFILRTSMLYTLTSSATHPINVHSLVCDLAESNVCIGLRAIRCLLLFFSG